MLGWIRNARLDFKTGIVIIGLALLLWAIVIYVNVRDFVPETITQPTQPDPR